MTIYFIYDFYVKILIFNTLTTNKITNQIFEALLQ